MPSYVGNENAVRVEVWHQVSEDMSQNALAAFKIGFLLGRDKLCSVLA